MFVSAGQHESYTCVLSPFRCVRLCAALRTAAQQALLSVGFSKQEYWSGLLCALLPGIFPNQGWNPIFLPSLASLPVSPPSHPIPPLRSSQSTELRPLFSSFWLAVCFTQTVCICQCCFLNLSHPLLPALCPQVGSPRQHLYSCPANRFI